MVMLSLSPSLSLSLFLSLSSAVLLLLLLLLLNGADAHESITPLLLLLSRPPLQAGPTPG